MTEVEPYWMAIARRILEPLRAYHHHTVEGLENVPTEGPAIGLINHSLATYDAFLFGMSLYEHTGRLPRGLGDDNIFVIPGLARWAWDAGIRPASHAHGERILADGDLLWIAPGGTREALRPSSERYTVRWDRRKGWARLAVRTGAPIVLSACRAADDIYTVVDNPLTALAYQHLRWPVPVAYGIGPTPVPRPVRLTHVVAPPIQPPAFEPVREDEQVADLHADVVRRMTALLAA